MNRTLLALVLSAALSCIGTRAYYLNKIQALKIEVNATSLKVQEDFRQTEQKLQSQVTTLLEESYERQLEIARLASSNAQLVFELGGLRDPGSTSSSTTGNANKNSDSDSKTAAGKLSKEATQFLLDLTKEADEVREQLRLCQEFVSELPQCVK